MEGQCKENTPWIFVTKTDALQIWTHIIHHSCLQRRGVNFLTVLQPAIATGIQGNLILSASKVPFHLKRPLKGNDHINMTNRNLAILMPFALSEFQINTTGIMLSNHRHYEVRAVGIHSSLIFPGGPRREIYQHKHKFFNVPWRSHEELRASLGHNNCTWSSLLTQALRM